MHPHKTGPKKSIARLALRNLTLLAGALLLMGPAVNAKTPSREVLRDQQQILKYRAEFLGLELGNGEVRIDLRNGRYVMDIQLRNGGTVGDLLEANLILARATGAASTQGASWASYDLDHTYSRKNKRRVIAMNTRSGKVAAKIVPVFSDMGTPPASPAQQIAARDPLSSFLALSLYVGRHRLCQGEWPVFDGRHRYNIVAEALAPARLAGHGEVELTRCRVKYVPVAGYNPEKLNENRALPEPVFWFENDPKGELAPIVLIEAPTLLGPILIRRMPS